MDPDDYDRWQTEVVATCWRTLSEDGAIFYNHKPRPWDRQLKLPTVYGDGLPLADHHLGSHDWHELLPDSLPAEM